MHISSPPSPSPNSNSNANPSPEPSQTLTLENHSSVSDLTSLLSDELLLSILSKLPISQHFTISLVCKRWLKLLGRLVRSLKLLDWDFLESGRLVYRFPNLDSVDLIHACIRSPGNSGIVVTHKFVSVHLDSLFLTGGFICSEDLLSSDLIDEGLRVVALNCPNLRKIGVVAGSELGLGFVAKECLTLQELELHCCNDQILRGISGFRNLQIVKLVGSIDGFYDSVVSDIGLTILAQGCSRLVNLELCGCEGSYDGIKAIGQCCQMLEELSLCDHRMDGGWLSALSFCGNLRTLRLQSCKNIDPSPGPDEHLGSCPTLEELHLQHCQMRNKQSVKALFLVCEAVRELCFQDCWGLEDDVFRLASIFRRVKVLSLEECSLLTVGGLDSVIVSWVELQRLRVISCNNIKDTEVTPALATLFCSLKELKWQPDWRSLLSSGLEETGVGKRGGRFFKRG
ncbi:F-box domain [Dillenia turbinata]|uniref:F-box domain n=1 Tax=Dillenia turbinata TaxID=194707 RepID=A0AAN8Z0U2_9MAGN